MMSYLWILLLGGLLATSVKAQDDPVSVEATVAPEAQTDEAIAPEDNVEPTADLATVEDAVEDIPETTALPVADEEDPTAAEDTEPADPTPMVLGEEDTTPKDVATAEDPEVTTPTVDDTEEGTAAPEDVEPEKTTPETADVDPEAANPEFDTEETTVATDVVEITTPVAEDVIPALADRDAPETDGTTQDNAVEDLTASPDTPAGGMDTSEEAIEEKEEDDDKEIPTDEVMQTESTIKAAFQPEVNLDFNLEDALQGEKEDEEEQPNAKPGIAKDSRMLEPGAHAAVNVDDPEAQKASSSSLAGILATIGVAAVGAVTGYFTYQKKKLCFKNRQEADPEAARKADAAEAQADPQVLNTLLPSPSS